MDTVQTKSHAGQGSDKKHHTVPSNSRMLHFPGLQALLPCKGGLYIHKISGSTQERIKSEDSCPTTFLLSSFFPIVPHSMAEQLAQQIAVNMEVYMCIYIYEIGPNSFI